MADLDKVIHQPSRLRIMASLVVLDPDDLVDFVYLRRLLKLTDGNLGGHLQKLEQTGYVVVEKTFVARKPRSHIAVTDKGRAAFHDHVIALGQIISGQP